LYKTPNNNLLMAAPKFILSSLSSKWIGHTIATIFLPRSYC